MGTERKNKMQSPMARLMSEHYVLGLLDDLSERHRDAEDDAKKGRVDDDARFLIERFISEKRRNWFYEKYEEGKK